MRITAFFLVAGLAGAAFAAGQGEPGAPAPVQRGFRLDLRPLSLPGYEPARELRLALWDSPMSRLELGVWREQWAVRNPGPAGYLVPVQVAPLPLSFRFDSADQLLLGPWSRRWDELTWQEKVAAGAQTTFFAWVMLEMLSHAH